MTVERSQSHARTASRPAVRTIASTLAVAARSKLSAYLDLLVKWNRVYNLTAIRDRDRMDALHIEDALAVLPFLPDRRNLRILDVGSGGGIPGIPLAIARSTWNILLVDSSAKKVSFMRQAAIELGLTNVAAEAVRIEEFRNTEPFDVVISRAFSDLPTFARVAKNHAATGGLIVAMKGVLPNDEIAALPEDVVVTGTPALDVAGVDAVRHLVIMQMKGGLA